MYICLSVRPSVHSEKISEYMYMNNLLIKVSHVYNINNQNIY